MQPAKINYKIYQGSTFKEVYRWESQTKVYVPIQSIAKSAPCVVTTTTAHNVPVGWRFQVVGAGGMKEINSIGENHYVSTGTSYVAPTLIDTDAAEDAYLGTVAVWEDAKYQDAETVAPVVRPWATMNPEQTLAFIQQNGQQVVPPVPNHFPPMLTTVRNAYLGWQLDLAENQARIAAAQASVANKITINQVNSLNFTTYTSGGVVEYGEPVNLANYSARMQIRETVDSPTVIYEATSQSGQIVLDNVSKTITITLLANATSQFNFTTAVYSLELFNGNNVVPFLVGNLTLVPEVTR
jgi:hypothetical protein